MNFVFVIFVKCVHFRVANLMLARLKSVLVQTLDNYHKNINFNIYEHSLLERGNEYVKYFLDKF